MDGRLRNMTSLYLTDEEGVWCLYRIGSRVIGESFVGAAGGHFEEGELNDARACVLREAYEELGLEETELEGLALRYITLRLAGGEIRQNYYFFARLKKARELSSSEGRLEKVPYGRLGGLNMPVSAKHMIEHYAAVGRFDNVLYAGVTGENGTRFEPLAEF